MLEARKQFIPSRRSPSLESRLKKTGIIIPPTNAEVFWPNYRVLWTSRVFFSTRSLVVDSSSTDATCKLAKDAGYT